MSSQRKALSGKTPPKAKAASAHPLAPAEPVKRARARSTVSRPPRQYQPAQPSVQLNIRLEQDRDVALTDLAAREGVTKRELVSRALEKTFGI